VRVGHLGLYKFIKDRENNSNRADTNNTGRSCSPPDSQEYVPRRRCLGILGQLVTIAAEPVAAADRGPFCGSESFSSARAAAASFGGGNGGVVMMLADLTGPDDCCRVPHIDYGDLRFLWLTNVADGPRSGVLEYAGGMCGYELVGERVEEASLYHQFAVFRLAADQIAEETRRHKDLKQRACGGRDLEWWMEAYRQRTPPDYSGCEVIGWFEC
jgi:hypothetical protein